MSEMDIEIFYKLLLKSNFEPYDYQIKVARLLLGGKNVILSVPTGAGKTWASIMPFLFALANPEKFAGTFPSKMIYSLPLRTLANSISEDVNEALKNSIFSDSISLQTGEYNTDKYFEKDIVFSTIDQTLSNFLCFPLPLSQRQANINAGALIGSYLVFDEFHLLDEKLSMATTIGALKMLGNLSRCCIMTATLSSDFMLALQKELGNYEIVSLEEFPEDKKKIGSLKPTINKKKIEVAQNPISAKDIIKHHCNKSIVICNRVETAQKTYFDLDELFNRMTDMPKPKIMCLHSRFFDDDRKEKEQRLKELFGKQANDESVILIATQVIEAGMDISCEVMHSEISPINSFLQRAGRCARFSDQTGKIYIYDLLEVEEKERITIEPETQEDRREIKKINNKYLPYDPNLCKRTLIELSNFKTLDGSIPQELIETILGGEEKEIIERMQSGKDGGFNMDKINFSWENCEKSNYRNTIRDIQSIDIIIISDKIESEICKYPYSFQSLGMYKWSFVGWLNKVANSEKYDHEDWLVKKLEGNNFIGEFENDEDVNFKLAKITDFKNLPNQVYVNGEYFGYDPLFGFNYEYSNTFGFISPKRELKNITEEFKPLTKDTFYEHNNGLLEAFKKEFLGSKNNKLDFIFTELANYFNTPSLTKTEFIKAIRLMIILHDYGKLNTPWQQKMQHYQALSEGVIYEGYPFILGHTDFDSKNERDIELAKEARLNDRPPHAGVGAYVAQEIIPQLFNDYSFIKAPISIAIARHHSPLSMSYPQFSISEKNFSEMDKLLKKYNFEVFLQKSEKYKGEIDSYEFSGCEEKLLYLFFVRILRLCDQKATENLKCYFNN
jgi:CRISPR-associated endonuclease/helicase Cas3